MQIPLKISYHQIDHSEAVETRIRKRVDHLERLCSRIISCRVTLEALTRRRQQGNLYSTHIELRLPGTVLIAGRDPGLNGAHEDIFVSIRDSFDAIESQLDDYLRKHRVRVHLFHREKPKHAEVVRILRGDGEYGFLKTPEGREIYFHKNSVLNGSFDSLDVGTEVKFIEEMGDQGPQASTVDIVGRERREAV